MTWDLVIIGGGVAGTTAALLAAEKGLRTVLIYDAPLGGLCLHKGCIPAKVCLQNHFSDFEELCAKRENTIHTLYTGLVNRLEESGVRLVSGHGSFEKKENVFHVHVANETLTCSRLIVATGSQPVVPPCTIPVEDVFVADQLPATAVVLGAGAAGLEAAFMLQKMGTKVTLLERESRILPSADPELSNALLRSLRRKGVSVQCSVQVQSIEQGQVQTLRKCYPAEWIVSAMGRQCEAVQPMEGLFVVGDALGHHQTAHSAIREAECAVRMICGEEDDWNYRAVPNVVFSNPPCAFVGEEGVQSATVSMKSCGGELAAGGDGTGVLKLSMDEKGNVCGMQICATAAPELISTGTVLIESETSVRKLSRIVFPHPTVSEAIHTAALELLKGAECHE